MDKKQAIWLDKAARILGLTLAGVIAFALTSGVAAVMVKRYVEGKRRDAGKRHATSQREETFEGSDNEVSDLLEWLRGQLLQFSRSYETAVQEGADEALLTLASDAGEFVRPSDIPVGKLLSAIRVGALHAGLQLTEAGRTQVGRLLNKDRQDS